jgi:DNA (cytosine-5)-methyltransferase 1
VADTPDQLDAYCTRAAQRRTRSRRRRAPFGAWRPKRERAQGRLLTRARASVTVHPTSMARRPAHLLPLPFNRGVQDGAWPVPTREGLRTVGMFAGVGGIEMGLARAGHRTDLLVEIEPGAQAVLRNHFADVELHDDVRTLRSLPKEAELVVGGFPCQDLSQAGSTAGIEGSRSGLVGEVFRLLRRKRVAHVLLENVPFMLQLSKGRAMEVIVATFEDLGYRWAYRVVNTRAFGLPQRRERVLFLASRDDDPRDIIFADEVEEPAACRDPLGEVACGFYWTEGVRGLGWAVDSVPTLKGGSTIGIPSSPAIVMPNGDVVTPDIRDAERMQGFPVDWTLPALGVTRAGHRWKLVGNAVTVDVAEWVGRRLRAPSIAGRDVAGCALSDSKRWPRAAWNVGRGRHSADLSAFPVRRRAEPLHQWLEFDPKLLSAKAAAGFLSRSAQGTLRFPPGFLELVRNHLARMERGGASVERSVRGRRVRAA